MILIAIIFPVFSAAISETLAMMKVKLRQPGAHPGCPRKTSREAAKHE